jgi:hypothetical protein
MSAVQVEADAKGMDTVHTPGGPQELAKVGKAKGTRGAFRGKPKGAGSSGSPKKAAPDESVPSLADMDVDRTGVAELAKPSALELLTATMLEIKEDVAELLRRSERRPPRHPRGYVSLRRAAEDCGHCVETLRLWAVRGEISATRVGGVWSVKFEDVQARAGRK